MGTPPSKAPPELILGSASPRRRTLMQAMGCSFEVVTAVVEETYPDHLKGHQITDYLALLKNEALRPLTPADSLVLTADTIVWFDGRVMEKPTGIRQARETLLQLSGKSHEVITSVCFRQGGDIRTVHAVTEVRFSPLDAGMIDAYFKRGHPLDKAGAYGIQEWIGLTAVEEIRGSYTNVVGLPTHLVYKTLRGMGFPFD